MNLAWQVYFFALRTGWWLLYGPLTAWYAALYLLVWLYFRVYGTELRPLVKKVFRLELFLYERAEELTISYSQWLDPTQTKETIMKALDTRKTHEYVCKREQKFDPADKTVFIVKSLTAQASYDLRDEMYQVKGAGKARSEKFLTGTAEYKTLEKGLVGWRNLKDEDGKEVAFDSKNFPEMISHIPEWARTELADHIRGASELNEGEG